jgi:DNA-3-methyladenine glycosylase
MPRRLTRSFFCRPTLMVARDLLGMRLVRQVNGRRSGGRIVEVEAYIGEDDTACHASRGLTRRNAVMFGPPGFAYVYFTYGMHWMLNFVTERKGFPAAVLLRAIEPDEGIESLRRRRRGRPDRELTAGPARLCKALAIDGSLNGSDLVRGRELFIEDEERVPDSDVLSMPRIGIDYSERKDREAAWRFVVASSPFVSRVRRSRVRRADVGRARP